MATVLQILPQIAVTHHCWLYANSIAAAGLIVYRSPLLRDSDKIYRPVAAFLKKHSLVPVFRASIPDPSMMMAQGDLIIYTPPPLR